ncbi:probable polygalacturonase At1g80170 [Macadamia integrifolia]|uniref:probable polygalacturonase At1g80170 n=1 Tax=Macadamia integrifolia TaxID=60698 RepID=UPI001C4FBC59|nr:probable polygalacturonase At1g80170 [Macadamia integrifolia]
MDKLLHHHLLKQQAILSKAAGAGPKAYMKFSQKTEIVKRDDPQLVLIIDSQQLPVASTAFTCYISSTGQLAVLITLCVVNYWIIATAAQKSFSVVDYGAVGDGRRNDANAFLKAWSDACNFASGVPTIFIPQRKTFLVEHLTLKGPCKANKINVKIHGNIKAPNSPSAWNGMDSSRWIWFDGINGLTISGPGLIDGQGSLWWKQSCRYNNSPGCTSLAPTALWFSSCKRLTLNNMNLANSPQTHILLIGCQHVLFNTIKIKAPGSSPNTDGIHIQSSQFVNIYHSNIESGDDCISIGDFTSHIIIKSVNCGPGHGISIGSLGKGPNGPTEAQVENITVSDGHFVGTTNGARIKTWQGGRGYARKITFEQLNFINVKNPIIIDQSYCAVAGACEEQPSGVHVSDVTYRGIRGTSSTKEAVNFNCSHAIPCTGILMDKVELVPAKSGQNLISRCAHAYGRAEGACHPQSCLKAS